MADESEVVQRDKESLRFFHVICYRDPIARKKGLDLLKSSFDALIDRYGSPREVDLSSNNISNGFDAKRQIIEHLPGLLRLSIQCPFKDVRETCKSILADIKERKGIKLPRKIGGGPSHFIAENDVVPVDTEDEQTKLLFMEAFIQNNRVPNIIQLMSYHPDYLDCFLKTQHYLLHEDGPLPFDYRHYISIMACGRHQCSYLIKLQAQEFLLHGGNPEWLKGIDYVPQKLQDFLEINKILAHRPWLITKEHIEKLIAGKNRWSLSELTHALILCTHFHALSTFVFGCGLNDEIDFQNGHTFSSNHVDNDDSYSSDSSSLSDSANNSDEEGGLSALMARMKELTERKEEELTIEERLKDFAKVESQSAEITTSQKIPSPRADILRYVEDPNFTYKDFAKRDSVTEIPSFRAQDYSWEEHGFSLANRLYNEIGTLLDDKFNMAYNLTYYTMGNNTQVDTSSFRKAIWSYIHCMYGIRHDDYNYGEVNQLLERNLKAYIKTVTCYPERLTKKDYDGVMKEFKHSEKVHVNLMLLEARMQAELLYALRAVMKYMT